MSIFWPRKTTPKTCGEERYTFQGWVNDVLKFGGNTYGLGQNPVQQSWAETPVEQIAASFAGYVDSAFGSDAVVFGIELKRMSIFSDARFQFRRITDGRPGDLFGGANLGVLEKPWPGGTTGDLLSKAILDADMAGNSFWARIDNELVRLRPDWVDIAVTARMAPYGSGGKPVHVGWRKEGYFYYQDGDRRDISKAAVFLPDEVAHFAPIPDPLATYRGMSWLTPVIREIQADKTATEHHISYLSHGGTPNFVVTLPRETTKQQFELFKQAYEESHGGPENAYGTLLLTAGADATVLGSTMQQLDMKALRGLNETRIAMAGGIHPVVLGSSEGMSGSSLNAGNYTAAKRSTADGTFRPLWRNMAGSFEVIVPPPDQTKYGPAQLWYDEATVAFLREDMRDQAEAAALDAQIIRQLGDGGWEMESIKAAMKAGYDWSRLVPTGLVPVQLQPPGTGTPTPAAPPA